MSYHPIPVRDSLRNYHTPIAPRAPFILSQFALAPMLIFLLPCRVYLLAGYISRLGNVFVEHFPAFDVIMRWSLYLVADVIHARFARVALWRICGRREAVHGAMSAAGEADVRGGGGHFVSATRIIKRLIEECSLFLLLGTSRLRC